jgi:hypothetical protein
MTQAAVNKINQADTVVEESGNTTLTLSRLLAAAIESNDPDNLGNAISQVYAIRPDLRLKDEGKSIKQVAISLLANELKV